MPVFIFVLQSETDSTLDSKDNTPTPQSHSVIPGGELFVNHAAKQDAEGFAGSPETVEKKSLTPSMMSSGYSSTVGLEDIAGLQKCAAASDEGGIIGDSADDAAAKTSCLIDSAIPSDLGSPLKPATPYCERQIAEELETNNNRNVATVTSESDDEILDRGAVGVSSCFQDSADSSVVKSNPVCETTGIGARQKGVAEVDESAIEEPVSDSADSCDVDKWRAKGPSSTAADVPVNSHGDSKEGHSNGTDGDRCSDAIPAVVRLPPTNTSGKLRPRQADKSSDRPANAPMKATYRPLSMPPEMIALDDKDASFGSQDEMSEHGLFSVCCDERLLTFVAANKE
jgi:hypothetical protein